MEAVKNYALTAVAWLAVGVFVAFLFRPPRRNK
jgi:hypothetical protein